MRLVILGFEGQISQNKEKLSPNRNEGIFLKWQTRSRHRSLDVQLIKFGYPAQLLCSNEVSEVCWYLLLPFGFAFCCFLAIRRARQFCISQVYVFRRNPDPREVEAMDLLHGLLWAHELGHANIQFEVDYKNVVDGILASPSGITDFHVLLSN
ncbi:hypothetical protein HKD37_09G026881 [Glycine soja]